MFVDVFNKKLNKFSFSGRNADKCGQTDRQKDRNDKANRRFSLFITERLKMVAEGNVPVGVLWIHLACLNAAGPTVF